MKYCLVIGLLLSIHAASAQSNIVCTNPVAEQVMKGNYDPAGFLPAEIVSQPDAISAGINATVSADSLRAYLDHLGGFFNRNTGSDTVSATIGIGAARRWVYQKFLQFSTEHNNRLLPAYLQFDQLICNAGQHRNVMAVLPGLDTSDHAVVIIESHLDSRCEGVCDTLCKAQGIDDNGSGTALVIELARVMSKYSFNHTIVFAANIGEEQGLYGAEAFADYVQQNNIVVKAVLNNDIVGGVLCGNTSSPPSCAPPGDVDSVQVRLFSYGGFNSPHKGLARFIKLEYKEQLLPIVNVPMELLIMTGEDRTGRGGDHIPFRQHGYTAIRFTSANENGNANVTAVGYSDNQHTSRDVLGYDTNNDSDIDSFLVDLHYLARNTIINGNTAAMAALSPMTPDFTMDVSGNQVTVHIASQQVYPGYRIGVRSFSYDWDTVYIFNTPDAVLELNAGNTYFLSAATVDSNGVESLFSGEIAGTITSINDPDSKKNIQLLPAYPNPADESTMITVNVLNPVNYTSASIRIVDSNGNPVQELPVKLNKGINEVLFRQGFRASGLYYYQLIMDGTLLETRKIIFGK